MAGQEQKQGYLLDGSDGYSDGRGSYLRLGATSGASMMRYVFKVEPKGLLDRLLINI